MIVSNVHFIIRSNGWDQLLQTMLVDNTYSLLTCLPTYLLPYVRTYLLTPWNRILLEKLTGSHLVTKFPEFYGICKFIFAITSACHVSLTWPLVKIAHVKELPSGLGADTEVWHRGEQTIADTITLRPRLQNLVKIDPTSYELRNYIERRRFWGLWSSGLSHRLERIFVPKI
jgi:hypothetical protein